METGDDKEATHLVYLRGAEREVWKGMLRMKVMGRRGEKNTLGIPAECCRGPPGVAPPPGSLQVRRRRWSSKERRQTL